MEVVISLLLLISGFSLLVFGGDYLVKSAVNISLKLKVSRALIGLTVVAAGTSAPELITSIIAAFQGAQDIALGNVIGSNIFNILAILGITCIYKVHRVGKSFSQFEVPALVLTSGILIFFAWDKTLSLIDGLILLSIYVLFLVISFKRSKAKPKEGNSLVADLSGRKTILYLLLGMGGLIIGAELALKGGVGLGHFFGLSDRVIGVTIISIGTGLPELVTSIVAAFKGEDDLSIANVVGSNMMNSLVVVGTTTVLTPLNASDQLVRNDGLWMLGVTIVFAVLLFINKYKITKPVGYLFLGTYIYYLYQLI